MQQVYAQIWIVGLRDREKKFRGMAKVAGVSRWPDQRDSEPVYYLSAADAFKARESLGPEIAKSFGVYEIPISRVFELQSPEEEGISCRADYAVYKEVGKESEAVFTGTLDDCLQFLVDEGKKGANNGWTVEPDVAHKALYFKRGEEIVHTLYIAGWDDNP